MVFICVAMLMIGCAELHRCRGIDGRPRTRCYVLAMQLIWQGMSSVLAAA